MDDKMWSKEENKINDSWENDIHTYGSIKTKQYKFVFGKLTEAQKGSVLFKIDSYEEQDHLQATEFAIWMIDRRINFDLEYIGEKGGFKDNLIRKIKFNILRIKCFFKKIEAEVEDEYEEEMMV